MVSKSNSACHHACHHKTETEPQVLVAVADKPLSDRMLVRWYGIIASILVMGQLLLEQMT
jgi:hypothetical protein